MMMASALRWMPPVAAALIHNGFALLLLLDCLRLEAMGGPRVPAADPAAPSRLRTGPPPPALTSEVE
jgi:hypothetical protein